MFFFIFKTYLIRTHGLVYIMIAKRSLTTKLALKMITVSTSKCAKSRSHEQTKNSHYYHKIYLNNPNCNHMY